MSLASGAYAAYRIHSLPVEKYCWCCCRDHEEAYRTSLGAAQQAEADQKQQAQELQARLAEQSDALQSAHEQLASSEAQVQESQGDLQACQRRLAEAQHQAHLNNDKAAEEDLQQQIRSQELALKELQQRWEATGQEASTLRDSSAQVVVWAATPI